MGQEPQVLRGGSQTRINAGVSEIETLVGQPEANDISSTTPSRDPGPACYIYAGRSSTPEPDPTADQEKSGQRAAGRSSAVRFLTARWLLLWRIVQGGVRACDRHAGSITALIMLLTFAYTDPNGRR
jgi:hypothetical protein